MTCMDNITTNDILTLRLQANGGEITTETFISVLDAYEEALEAVEEGFDQQDELEREVKSLERSGEKAGKEIAQLEDQVTMLQAALAEATKLARKAKRGG